MPDDDGIAPALSFVGLQSINIFILDQINNVLLLISKHALVLQQPSMSWNQTLYHYWARSAGTEIYRVLVCSGWFWLIQ